MVLAGAEARVISLERSRVCTFEYSYIVALASLFKKRARDGITTFPHRCGCQRQPRPSLAVPPTGALRYSRTDEKGHPLSTGGKRRRFVIPSAVKFHACPAETQELTVNRHDAPSRTLPSVGGGGWWRRERSFMSQRVCADLDNSFIYVHFIYNL